MTMASFAHRFIRRSFRRLARRFGYDLRPFPGGEEHWPHLVSLLERHAVTCVFDVGANLGQYAAGLRGNGYAGHIVSFEPLRGAHETLSRKAAGDALWEIAPRTALGAKCGEAVLHVSPRSDMSSLLTFDPDARQRLAKSQPTGTERVPVSTLAEMLNQHAKCGARVFVKSDTQGYEAQVLSGIEDEWGCIAGLQLELSLQPIYEGQPDHLPLLNRIAERGFRPHLVVPGPWSRGYGRMLEYDVVCFREEPRR